jgi:hypothetical protein
MVAPTALSGLARERLDKRGTLVKSSMVASTRKNPSISVTERARSTQWRATMQCAPLQRKAYLGFPERALRGLSGGGEEGR